MSVPRESEAPGQAEASLEAGCDWGRNWVAGKSADYSLKPEQETSEFPTVTSAALLSLPAGTTSPDGTVLVHLSIASEHPPASTDEVS